ncbi:hypothetical protein PILCRDRAFT_196554 [Piloderma croceum F 1598]|uniref:Uncharacterized protein n=1 Tax=Piloderma croceum (strain F 1598) TaxID=765440 RepID=A0A0C3CJA3_PILCF|nr:hypothetical protein PILCRDRAFT_196554 [Piloderma croceum F 1598]
MMDCTRGLEAWGVVTEKYDMRQKRQRRCKRSTIYLLVSGTCHLRLSEAGTHSWSTVGTESWKLASLLAR